MDSAYCGVRLLRVAYGGISMSQYRWTPQRQIAMGIVWIMVTIAVCFGLFMILSIPHGWVILVIIGVLFLIGWVSYVLMPTDDDNDMPQSM